MSRHLQIMGAFGEMQRPSRYKPLLRIGGRLASQSRSSRESPKFATAASALFMTILLVAATAWNAHAAVCTLGSCTQVQVNSATQSGVAFIDSKQNADGSFGTTAPIAETGMALVAYGVLANGSFSNLPAAYQTHVMSAITWLLGQQAPATAQFPGSWADAFFFTYSTGLAIAGLSFFPS